MYSVMASYKIAYNCVMFYYHMYNFFNVFSVIQCIYCGQNFVGLLPHLLVKVNPVNYNKY